MKYKSRFGILMAIIISILTVAGTLNTYAYSGSMDMTEAYRPRIRMRIILICTAKCAF